MGAADRPFQDFMNSCGNVVAFTYEHGDRFSEIHDAVCALKQLLGPAALYVSNDDDQHCIAAALRDNVSSCTCVVFTTPLVFEDDALPFFANQYERCFILNLHGRTDSAPHLDVFQLVKEFVFRHNLRERYNPATSNKRIRSL